MCRYPLYLSLIELLLHCSKLNKSILDLFPQYHPPAQQLKPINLTNILTTTVLKLSRNSTLGIVTIKSTFRETTTCWQETPLETIQNKGRNLRRHLNGKSYKMPHLFIFDCILPVFQSFLWRLNDHSKLNHEIVLVSKMYNLLCEQKLRYFLQNVATIDVVDKYTVLYYVYN